MPSNHITFTFITKDGEELTVSGTYTHEVPARIHCLPEDAHPVEDGFFCADKITCEDGTEYKGDICEDELYIEASENLDQLID